MKSIPISHIAIIPDGNRRWARQQGLKPEEGHLAGFDCTKNIMLSAIEHNVANLSFWGSSMNNLTKRSLSEVKNLYFGFKKHFTLLLEEDMVHTHKVKVNVLGKWREYFPQDLIRVIDKLTEATELYDQYTMNFFLGYNGDEEMLSAIQMIVDKASQGVNQEINARYLKQHLYTRDLPPVDLLIRTGGEPHNSVGFMMWDTANSQYYFTDICYPEFSPAEFEKAMVEYDKREKRCGK